MNDIIIGDVDVNVVIFLIWEDYVNVGGGFLVGRFVGDYLSEVVCVVYGEVVFFCSDFLNLVVVVVLWFVCEVGDDVVVLFFSGFFIYCGDDGVY